MSFFSELRRRNVFGMVLLYAVAAWLIMQVAEVVVTLASLPNRTLAPGDSMTPSRRRSW
jgi:hypothetical protein